MKKFLSIMILSLVSVCSYSQKVSNTDFIYPIKPGDNNWEKFNSIEERIASLQIPEKILADIPTGRLLDICLDYPYLNPGIYVVSAIIRDKIYTGKIYKQ